MRSHSFLTKIKKVSDTLKNSLALSHKIDTISYFFISIIIYLDHGNLQKKKDFTLICSSRMLKPILIANAWNLDHRLRVHRWNHKEEEERGNGKWPKF